MAPVRESRTVTSSWRLRRCAKAERKVSATLVNSVYKLGSRGDWVVVVLKLKKDEGGIGVCGEESVTGSGLGITIGM